MPPDTAKVTGMAVDGKTVRGAKNSEGKAPHLVSAVRHDTGTTAGQRRVPAKTNEIKAFAPLLEAIDVTGMAITADALHTQRAHATYLHKRKAFYVFYAMGNQPGLFATLDALDWKAVPIGYSAEKLAHGRRELRTLQVRPPPPRASASPTPPRPSSPPSYAANGRSRPSTKFATPPTPKTPPTCAPATHPASWRPYAHWPSAS
jgi:predicted transposase YbfD/YdcC